MPKFLQRFTESIHPETRPVPGRFRGQSFLELALILPILLIMLMGLVEVSLFIGRYLDILDLTREAARFASVRDPFVTVPIENVSCSLPPPMMWSSRFTPPPETPTPKTQVKPPARR